MCIRDSGYTVFVEGALPEEVITVLIVKTKKHFGYGKLLEILEPSPWNLFPDTCKKRYGVNQFLIGNQLQGIPDALFHKIH